MPNCKVHMSNNELCQINTLLYRLILICKRFCAGISPRQVFSNIHVMSPMSWDKLHCRSDRYYISSSSMQVVSIIICVKQYYFMQSPVVDIQPHRHPSSTVLEHAVDHFIQVLLYRLSVCMDRGVYVYRGRLAEPVSLVCLIAL